MANLEVLALDTAVPQIRAPGVGDGYSVPRDMTMASGTTLSVQTLSATAANANVSLAPTGTGVVTINPATAGTMNNVAIGGSTAAAGTFTTLTTSSTNTLNGLTASTALALNASKQIVSVTNTGTGDNVLATSPTLVTPTLGAASATSVAAGLGLVGTPSYTFTGDLNTGMWSPTADTVAWSTGGSERMRIDSSGNVGIGTTSPDAKLTVSGAASFADGTASAPGIANTGDLDTGMYFPAANEAAITTGGTVAAAFNSNGLFFRNRIINGDMRIDQRNAGASVTQTATNIYSVDRWQSYGSVTSKMTLQRSTVVPTGFTNSLLVTSSSAYSVLSSDIFIVRQQIEGFNVADLNWGTSSAVTVTLSFWVRSSLTGTFGGSFASTGGLLFYPFTYTINSANTWEQKTITVAGPTTGGATTDNSASIQVIFGLGVGSSNSQTAGSWTSSSGYSATGATSVVGTNGATWYVTGVQLETGSVATPFERRPYGTELMLCQRYYYRTTPTSAGRIAMAASSATNSTGRAVIPFPVTMRAAPSALEQSGTAGDYSIFFLTTATACTSVPTFSTGTVQASEISWTATAGHTAGNAGTFYSTATAGFLAWSAEL